MDTKFISTNPLIWEEGRTRVVKQVHIDSEYEHVHVWCRKYLEHRALQPSPLSLPPTCGSRNLRRVISKPFIMQLQSSIASIWRKRRLYIPKGCCAMEMVNWRYEERGKHQIVGLIDNNITILVYQHNNTSVI